ncbi:ABC transporter permease subunit [soil metagenome]
MMVGWFTLNPVTRKRLQRFRSIKRGYYSLLVFLFAIMLSIFANFLANNRPMILMYEGKLYFPTFEFLSVGEFGQQDIYGFTDAEADYRRLKVEWKDTRNWMLLPPIHFNPVENDFGFYKDPPPNAPDSRHLLGTDSQGRDVLARLLYGFRISIFFSLALVTITMTIGVTAGLLQGYFGGRFDILGQRFVEIWSTLPPLYMVIIIGTALRPTFGLLLIVLAVFDWMGITYYMRTESYREKSREYVTAARAMGASHWRIIFKHLLPNSLTPLITTIPFSIIAGIFSLTSLDFLGYGLPPPTPSWGELMEQALDSTNRSALWLTLSPFAAIFLTLLVVTLIGESLREAFDPKRYTRYE